MEVSTKRKQCETYKDEANTYPKFLLRVKQWEIYKEETKIFISKLFSLEEEMSVATTKEIFYQNRDFGNNLSNQKVIKIVILA